MKMSHRTVEG